MDGIDKVYVVYLDGKMLGRKHGRKGQYLEPCRAKQTVTVLSKALAESKHYSKWWDLSKNEREKYIFEEKNRLEIREFVWENILDLTNGKIIK